MSPNPPSADFMIGLSIALRILSSRALCFIALFMSGGMFAWAMIERSVIAFAAATTFAVITYLPALWRDRGSSG